MNNQMARDRAVGGVLMMIGAVTALATKAMQVKMRLSAGDPGPKLFLYIAAVGLMVCGAGIILSRVPDTKMLVMGKKQWGKFVFLFLVLIGYLLGLKYLGFIISTPLAAFVLIYVLKKEKKINLAGAAAYALILTGALYLVFVKLLSIVLPRGLFF